MKSDKEILEDIISDHEVYDGVEVKGAVDAILAAGFTRPKSELRPEDSPFIGANSFDDVEENIKKQVIGQPASELRPLDKKEVEEFLSNPGISKEILTNDALAILLCARFGQPAPGMEKLEWPEKKDWGKDHIGWPVGWNDAIDACKEAYAKAQKGKQ